MANVSVQGITKTYPRFPTAAERFCVLNDISFSVGDGELVTFVGPNGSGKTTLLNIVAGLSPADRGTVRIGTKSPGDCVFGYVFQNYVDSLLPWRTVLDNIGFPLEIRGVDRPERNRRVEHLLQSLDISLPLDRYPYQLSGGQQQLVAISRALIGSPDLLLMDESFSQLDYRARRSMLDKVLDVWRKFRLTILVVSHDIEEALVLGDRVLFLGGSPTRVTSELRTNNEPGRNHRAVITPRFRDLVKQALEIVDGANCQ